MVVTELGLHGLKLVSSPRFTDSRGWFAEAFNSQHFAQAGLPATWAQDNHSCSRRDVLRGLHFQTRKPQGKLVRVLHGRIWDVAVDLRPDSPDFGRWFGLELQAEPAQSDISMLWVPEGFAHGFLVLSPHAEVLYKVTQPYDPGGEHTLRWDDPAVGINWPLAQLHGAAPILSAKDAQGLTLQQLAPILEV